MPKSIKLIYHPKRTKKNDFEQQFYRLKKENCFYFYVVSFCPLSPFRWEEKSYNDFDTTTNNMQKVMRVQYK